MATHSCRNSVSPLSYASASSTDSEKEVTPPPTFSTPHTLQFGLPTPHSHINKLNDEVMNQVLFWLSKPGDLIAFILTQKRWYRLGTGKIWFKLVPRSNSELAYIYEQPPKYAQLVQRINFRYISRVAHLDQFFSLAKFQRVKKLVLANCVGLESPEVYVVLASLPELQYLDVSNTSVDDRIFEYITTKNKHIDTFYGGSVRITDAGVTTLARNTNQLRRVRLINCSFKSGKALAELALNNPHLVELFCTPHTDVLSEYKGFTVSEVKTILAKCPLLREVNLSDSPLISCQSFQYLNKSHVRALNLRNLTLANCTEFTPQSIKSLAISAPYLRNLTISKTASLTDSMIHIICIAYPHSLTHLSLSHCMNITDKAIKNVGTYLKNLSYFDAAGCQKLTDYSLASLAQLSKLERIGMVRCLQISDLGIQFLCNSSSPLSRIHLSYCIRITRKSVRELLESHSIIHLSLSGIPDFRNMQLENVMHTPQQPLPEFQRDKYVVFTGSGIQAFKHALTMDYYRSAVQNAITHRNN